MKFVFGLFLLVSAFGTTMAHAQVPKAKQPMSAALRNFSKANPHCAGWTDWRQFCSRTGPNGEDYCLTDPARPVKPSAVFCAAWDSFIVESNIEPVVSQLSQKSSFRFCLEPRIEYPLDQQGKEIKSEGYQVCDKYSARPFNRERFAARHHPWCKAWSAYVPKDPMPPTCQKGRFYNRTACGAWGRDRQSVAICAKGTKKNSKLCKTEVNGSFTGTFMHCAEWDVPKWCRSADTMVMKYDTSDYYSEAGIVIMDARHSAAYGLVCTKKDN